MYVGEQGVEAETEQVATTETATRDTLKQTQTGAKSPDKETGSIKQGRRRGNTWTPARAYHTAATNTHKSTILILPPVFKNSYLVSMASFFVSLVLCSPRLCVASVYVGPVPQMWVNGSTQITPSRSSHGYPQWCSHSRTPVASRARDAPRAGSCVPVCFSSPTTR